MTLPHGRILLVEDDEDQRSALAGLLSAEGYAVDEASSAEEALERLDACDFDLLVTDYMMGGASGAWLARIATRVGSPAPHVLMITGHDRPSDVDGLSVLRKPLDEVSFLAGVARALKDDPDERPLTDAAQRIALVLYVNDSGHSRRSERQLRAILAEYEPTQIALRVVDISKGLGPEAEDDRIVATPTLVKTYPGPRTWIAGDLATTEHVQHLLEQASVERRR